MEATWSIKKFDADAGKVYSDLMQVSERTPENIVEYAELHPDSELYKCFTWDNSKAAHKWRLQEARQVVCTLVFKDTEKKEPTKIRIMQHTDTGYEPVKMIVKHKDEYEALLERAWAELRAFKERYKNLAELEEILALID